MNILYVFNFSTLTNYSKQLFLSALIALFSIANIYAQSPGGVAPNLRLWLKADAGVIGASPVTSWADQSGNGFSATDANGPTLQNNWINFNPSLQFDGTNDELTITNGILGNASYTDMNVYYVGKANVVKDAYIFYEVIGTGGTGLDFGVASPWSDGRTWWEVGGWDANYGIDTPWGGTTGVNYLWSFNSSTTGNTPTGNNQEIFRDGLSLKNDNTATSFTANNSNFKISNDYAGNFVNGELAELIVYTGSITALEQRQIESYLAVKYGINKTGDFANSSGTTIWDATTNAGYLNDVVGIGRDDNSGLDQQKSTDSDVTLDKGGAFASDQDFILWGNNAAASGTSTNVPPGYLNRLNKAWRVDVTGTPGAVNFEIDLTGLGLPIALPAGDYALLIDEDGDFSNATVHTTGASIASPLLSFTGVDIPDGYYFSIAEINGLIQGPGGLATDLELWLKADAGISGASPVTAWADQSLLGNDATVTGNGPDLINSQLNFNPTLDFTRTNSEFLEITGGIIGNNERRMWVYYVARMDAVQTNTIFNENLNGTEYFASLNSWNSSQVYYQNGNSSTGGGGGRINGNWGGTNGIFNLWTMGVSNNTVTPNGTKKAISRDGTVFLSNTNHDNSVAGNGSNFYIGGRWTGANGSYLDGQIAELIVYTGVPSALEQNRVESYLAIKYGINKAGDFVNSAGTTIWDAATNAGYLNRVTGIGRDNNAGLDQRKSKSILSGSDVTIDKGGAFPSDMGLIIWGNDAAANGTSTNVDAGFDKRLNRVWKIDLTGAPGSVNFSIDLTDLGLPTALTAGDYALLIDADGDFSAGAVAHTAGAAIANSQLSFTGVNFSDGDFFTIAVTAGTLSGPGDVTDNLKLWLKADAGITGAAPVSGWDDQSGNAYNASVPTNGPDLLNSQLNFNPTLDFTSTNSEYLQIANGIFGTSSYPQAWVYYVLQGDVIQTNTVFSELIANSEQFGSINPWSNSNAYYQLGNGSTGGGGGRINGNWGGTIGEFDLWTLGISTNTSTPNGTKKAISRDGTVILSNTNNDNSVTGNNSAFNIGGRWNDADNYYLNGQIAELIVYTGVPSALEQNKVESYLSIKYGINKSGDYVNSAGTTIWDAAANAGYLNKVAGIGRDDNSTLDQQKSKSIVSSSDVTMDKGGAFPSDMGLIVWGNDNAANGTSTNVDAGFEKRLNRVWK
ncbi:MAG: hypothetical protein DRI54_02110, partial [Bacteroidetes bacterium]